MRAARLPSFDANGLGSDLWLWLWLRAVEQRQPGLAVFQLVRSRRACLAAAIRFLPARISDFDISMSASCRLSFS